MADAESRAQRAVALEERRRRLEELKKRRTNRRAASSEESKEATKGANLEEYIDGLLSQSATTTPGQQQQQQQQAQAQQQSQQQQQQPQDSATIENGSKAPANQETVRQPPSQPPPAPAPPPPKKVETFVASTQTEVEDFPEPPEGAASAGAEDAAAKAATAKAEAADQPPAEAADAVEKEAEEPPKLLSAEEVKEEVRSENFTTFLTRTSKKVERMLGAPVLLADLLLVDYDAADQPAPSEDEQQQQQQQGDEEQFVQARVAYECPAWTSNRDVTDMDWSPLQRELLLSTYHMPNYSDASSSGGTAEVAMGGGGGGGGHQGGGSTSSSLLIPRGPGQVQSDGLVCLWNLAMQSRPEHVFTCASPVTVGRFHPTEARLVVGGCDSGQVVVWDMRAGRLPVQKSALVSAASAAAAGSSSSQQHAHAICDAHVVDGGTGLVTTSTDGRVNFWSLGNLREPAESMQVGDSVSAVAVLPEAEQLVLGDDFGGLHMISAAQTASSSGSAAAAAAANASSAAAASSNAATAATTTTGQQRMLLRKQVRKLDSVHAETGENLGHYGMVTCLSTKPVIHGNRKPSLTDGWVLSAGVDWTVKLWAPTVQETPVMSWVSHSYDYMSAVQWSPTHPTLFATATSHGAVGLWNLASSMEEPISGQDGIVIESSSSAASAATSAAAASASSPQRGLNKLKWSADGRRLAVAAADRLHVLNLTPAVATAAGDEEQKVMHQLAARGLLSSSSSSGGSGSSGKQQA